MIRIVKKDSTSPKRAAAVRIASVVLALIIAGAIIAILGYNPFVVYPQMLAGTLGSQYCITQTIMKMIPLLVMGLGVSICFKMRFINIGAEGQFFAGAIGATYVALHQGSMPFWLTAILMFVAAFIGGGLWCLIAGVLKIKLGVSETLVTLMLNYVAVKTVSYLQYVAWKDPNAYGYPRIANFAKELYLPKVLGVHMGWIIALALTVLVALLIRRTKLGFEISVLGENKITARYAGMRTTRIEIITIMLGGGLCGLAGYIQCAGVEHTLNDTMSAGMGFTAIVIAYMAKMDPIIMVVVSALFAILIQGGSFIQTSMQIPAAAADVMQGIILLFVLCSEFFNNYKMVIGGRKGGQTHG